MIGLLGSKLSHLRATVFQRKAEIFICLLAVLLNHIVSEEAKYKNICLPDDMDVKLDGDAEWD